MRSGWFNCTEPSLATSLLLLIRRERRYGKPHRTYTLNTITELARCVGCFCTSSGWFNHSEPTRTYTNHTSTELARCVGCLGTRSGWYKHLEPHRTYTLLTITELATCVGCLSTRSGWFKHSGSNTSKLFEPTRTTPTQVCSVLKH